MASLSTLQTNYVQSRPRLNESRSATSGSLRHPDLEPVTLPFNDNQGRVLQIFRCQGDFVGGVLAQDGKMTVIPKHHIHTALRPYEPASRFLERISRHPPKGWDLVIDANLHLIVWPHLIAAGRPGPDWTPPRLTADPAKRTHMFRDKEGHLSRDTPANASRIEQSTGSKEHYKGTDRFGNDVYLKQNRDGTQSWARVVNGEIREGGVNHRFAHARFNRNTGRLDTWYRMRADAQQRGPLEGPRARARDLARRTDALFHRSGGGGGGSGGGKPPPGPGLRQFSQLLQQTGLVKSYNATNPHAPMPQRAGDSGEIGGVACSAAYIEGMFDAPDSMFVEDHCFAFPMLPGGQMPFTDQELGQILRELAIGVYTHSTIPFFSLHFRKEGTDLFPVIHPAYENTLVGRVISMLDYMMKGYLNGGVFQQEFVDTWHRNPDWETRAVSALDRLIDFGSYCQTEMRDSDYVSLATLSELAAADPTLPPVLRTFTGFRNSFRIIAEQRSIRMRLI